MNCLNADVLLLQRAKFLSPHIYFFQVILLAIELPCNSCTRKHNATLLPHALWGEQNELSMMLRVSHLKNHIHCNSSVNHVLKTKDLSGSDTNRVLHWPIIAQIRRNA